MRRLGRAAEDEDVSWLQTQRADRPQTSFSDEPGRARDRPGPSPRDPGARTAKIRVRRKTRLSLSGSSTEGSVSVSNDSHGSQSVSAAAPTLQEGCSQLQPMEQDVEAIHSFSTSLNSPPRGRTPSKTQVPKSPDTAREVLPLTPPIEGDHPRRALVDLECGVVPDKASNVGASQGTSTQVSQRAQSQSRATDPDVTIVDSGRTQVVDFTFDDIESILETAGSNRASLPQKTSLSHAASPRSERSLSFCLRVVAVDISDDPVARVKDLRCLDPLDKSLSWRTHGGGFRHLSLSGCWYDIEILGGDVLHVVLLDEEKFWSDSFSVPTIDLSQPIRLDDSNCLLVHLPDKLISPSKIVDGLSCPRRGLLSSRLTGMEGSSPAAVMGALKHDCIGNLVSEVWKNLSERSRTKGFGKSEGLVGRGFMDSIVQKAIMNRREDILACSLDQTKVANDLRALEANVVAWARRAFYDLSSSKENSINSESFGVYALKEVVAIEEPLCTPVVGIRGQIDIIAKGRLKSFASDDKGILFPIEIKTGVRKSSVLLPHKAQVILYVLALRMRELSNVSAKITGLSAPKCGVLLYVNAEGFDYDIIRPTWEDVKQLLIVRNQMAAYMRRAEICVASPLPPMLRSPNECGRCYRAAECMISHAAFESGSPESSGVPELFLYSTRGLSKSHLEFLEHWGQLIEMEASVVDTNMRQPWTQHGADLEREGEFCVSALLLDSMHKTEGGGCCLMLKRNTDIPQLFGLGDRVHLSVEAISCGGEQDIEDLLTWDITNIESCLGVGHISGISQRAISVDILSLSSRMEKAVKSSGVTIRLDKDDTSVGMGSIRCNAVRVLTDPHHPETFNKVVANSTSHLDQQTIVPTPKVRLRELVIDLAVPKFGTCLSEDVVLFCPDALDTGTFLASLPSMKDALQKNLRTDSILYIEGIPVYPGCNPIRLKHEFGLLNPGQQEAVVKALNAEDYLLILGVPGSGKTTVLSFIVRAMIAKGRRVLITAYTNAAVDNLLLKLADAGVTPSFACRIGGISAIHPSLKGFSFPHDTGGNVGCLTENWINMRIVATTVLSASSKSYLRGSIIFDHGIVDEAGQVIVPAVLGPLLLVKSFCLVGDYYQLPPLVNSKDAIRKGMGESLFKCLAESHPQAVVPLSCQYRMNTDIMSLCNALIYEHRLQCPNAVIACNRLVIPKLDNLIDVETDNGIEAWVLHALKPEHSVVLLNTDSLKGNKVNVHKLVIAF